MPHGPAASNRRANRLTQPWLDGRQPSFRAVLNKMRDVEPSRALSALRVDQRERWRAGERVPAREYLCAFPDLRGHEESAFELVYNEILIREELGEEFAAEEYLDTYPEFTPRLRLQLEVHRVLAAGSGPADDDEGEVAGLTLFSGQGGPGSVSEVLPHVPGYEVLRVLGRGGMGVVYEARQIRLNRPCALKMILFGGLAGPEDKARFSKEAEAVARFRHPNIVQVHALGECEGRPFLELEYAEGGDLAGRLDGTPQPAEAAARLVETLARAMHYAHTRGVVHRDLKPANILLAADGTVRVSDFGLSKLMESAAATALTQTGVLLGTPGYMAPEQTIGRSDMIGPAADIFAMGVVLYELLSGRGPFRGATPIETIEQVRTLEPPPLQSLRTGLSRDLDAICMKCLDKEPARRYADAEALAEDLRRHLGGEPTLARRSGPIGRLARTLDRGKYDKEFGVWGPIVLFVFCPLLFLVHLSVFVLAWFRSPYLVVGLQLPMIAILIILGLAAAVHRARVRAPATSPAVRLLASIIAGQVAGVVVIYDVYRRLFPLDRPLEPLAFYPFCTATMGTMFLALGGVYWGRLYLAGVACFVLAPLMALNLTWAPLEFGLLMTLTFIPVGLHLCRLGAGPPHGEMPHSVGVRR